MSKKSYRCPVCGIVFERFPSHVRCNEPKCSRDCYYKRKTTGETVLCSYCGEPVYVEQNDLERFEEHFCNQECQNKFSLGKQKKETVKWYRKINTKTGTKPIHRLTVEICLGRPLPSSLVVHHVNGDKFDNRLVNLEVHTNGDHTRLHKGIEVKPIWSGRDFLESLQNRPRKLQKLRKSLIGSLGQVDVDRLLQLS